MISACKPPPSYSAWPHRAAVALCCATFPLIWLGGLVTTYDAGMAVPDWPTTYGYNLFLYPWQTWLFGPFDLFIEHGHRLLGAVVGLMSIAFLAAVYRGDNRSWMRFGAWIMFGLILGQGILGGARVRLDERTLALAHACVGLATFAYATAMAVVTSRYWHAAAADQQATGSSAAPFIRLATLTAAIIFLQVIVGALLRHVPVGATPGFFRVAVWFHIALGVGVLVHVVLLMVRAWRDLRSLTLIARPIGILGLLVFAQIGLGAATWVLKYGWPSWFVERPFAAGFTVQANSLAQAMITTLHVAVGALILALSVAVTLRAWRFFRREPVTASRSSTLYANECRSVALTLSSSPG